MPTRIALVSGIFPPEIGGPAKFGSAYARWLVQEGFLVSVVAYTSGPSRKEIVEGVEVNLISRLQSFPKRLFSFVREIKKLKDSNHHFLAVGAFIEIYIARLFLGIDYCVKVPGDIVWERARNRRETTLSIDEFQSSRLFVQYKILRNAFSRSLTAARVILVPSDNLLELCKIWGLPQNKIYKVNNSIDCSKFCSNPTTSKEYDVLTVCRLTPWKGVGELIEVCANLNLRLLVVGDGPERQRLEDSASALGARVKFEGDLSEEFMPFIYSKAGVFVLNSAYEGLPHALIEAMASGCIAIAKDGTGSQEVISNEITGYLIRNKKELEKRLQDVTSDKLKYGDVSKRARNDVIQRFNQEQNFPRILKFIIPD